MVKFTKIFSLMLLSLSATGVYARLAEVDVMNEKLEGKALVAKIFNEQAKDKKSKLYAQLKDIVVGSDGDDVIRFKDKAQVITEDDIFKLSSLSAKYEGETEYLVRIEEYDSMGRSVFWSTPRIFKVRVRSSSDSGGPNQGETNTRELIIEEEVKVVSSKPSPDNVLREPESGKSSH